MRYVFGSLILALVLSMALVIGALELRYRDLKVSYDHRTALLIELYGIASEQNDSLGECIERLEAAKDYEQAWRRCQGVKP